MTRRRLPLVLAVVGAVLILAALVATSVVRASDTATLALPERPEVPVLITEPGVLDAVDADVTVRATADDGEPVVLAVGRTTEVEAWLADADHARVTGLSSWEELTVEVVVAEPETTDDATATATATPEATATPDPAETPAPDSVPDPAGSDLWVAESVSTGSTELSWSDSPGRWSLVAATDGTGPAPLVELEWGRQVSTPWTVPVVVLGAIVLLAGIVMIVLDGLAAREQRRRDETVRRRSVWEPSGTGPVATIPVSVTDTDPGTGERLSRRQIREMERAMARADRGRRTEEALPAVPTAPDASDAGPVEPEPSDDAARPDAAATDAVDELSEGRPEDEDLGGPQQEADGAAGTEQEPDSDDDAVRPPPSWRSVWGFGTPPATHSGAPGADSEGRPTDSDDDGEERR